MQPLVCTFVCSSQNASALSEEQMIHQPGPLVLMYISGGSTDISVSLSLQRATNQGVASSSLAGVQENMELWALLNGWRYCFFDRLLRDDCAVVISCSYGLNNLVLYCSS